MKLVMYKVVILKKDHEYVFFQERKTAEEYIKNLEKNGIAAFLNDWSWAVEIED